MMMLAMMFFFWGSKGRLDVYVPLHRYPCARVLRAWINSPTKGKSEILRLRRCSDLDRITAHLKKVSPAHDVPSGNTTLT